MPRASRGVRGEAGTYFTGEIAPNVPHRQLVAGVLSKPLGLDTLKRVHGAEAAS